MVLFSPSLLYASSPFGLDAQSPLVSEDGLYKKMQVDGPNRDARVQETDVKMERDKLSERDAMISETNAVGA